MEPKIRIFKSKEILAETFVKELIKNINKYSRQNKIFNIALSGGNTPEIIYSTICDKFRDKINWDIVHFYWSDERCVSPLDPESNFGMVFQCLLDNIKIDDTHIHRIRGEENPESEAFRYSQEIKANVRRINNAPEFDLIMLGLGTDGHTASIFPDQMQLLNSGHICDVSVHPVSKQKRITLTGKVLNNSSSVSFIVTGEEKSEIVFKIIKKTDDSLIFPASHINPLKGKLEWWLDDEASRLI
jgi:6-phosphogluconolactonase